MITRSATHLERIDPGNETHTFVNTPKVTSGVDDASLEAVDTFFAALVDTTVPVGSPAEAELVKLLENTFRHVNIALVNELAMFARELGVDVWRAIDAASTKPFGYMRFTPGPGVGGHCLPIDPSYLAWRVKQHLGQTFRFVELANDVNEHMPDYVNTRIAAMLNEQRKSVNGSRVLLLGLAYKRNTSDWRESPSVEVAGRLRAGGATVEFCDPNIPDVNAEHLDYRGQRIKADRHREIEAFDPLVGLRSVPTIDHHVERHRGCDQHRCAGNGEGPSSQPVSGDHQPHTGHKVEEEEPDHEETKISTLRTKYTNRYF